MRLDGMKGDRAVVWDCERCVRVRSVVWADDSSHQYAVHHAPQSLDLQVVQARRIQILHGEVMPLVLVNPLDDHEPEAQASAAEARRPQVVEAHP